MFHMRARVSWVWGAALCLAQIGCVGEPQPSDSDVIRAESLRPPDAQLAAKYERSCIVCHAVRAGAPMAGFEPAWKARVVKGHALLLAHARDGFNAMPAKGLCSDCSDEDLSQLIHFMSQSQ